MTRVSAVGELGSRRVQLRALLPSDLEWVYALVCGPAGARWRYRGRTPSHEAVAADLWRGVFAQFVVVEQGSERRCGLVGIYNVSLEAGRGYVFALAEPDLATAVTEGLGLLCRWAYRQQGLERLFVELPEFNVELFASLGDAAVVEGRLRNHEHWRGRYWDLVVLSLTSSAFEEHFGDLLRRRDGPPTGGGSLGQVEQLVAECWPLDSLGLVEVLDALEEMVGRPVDAEPLLAVDAATPQEWVAAALEAVGQPAGRSDSPPA